MKIIVGAGNTQQPGWISLQRNQLDVRDKENWAQLFPLDSLDAILAEHVLEHLTVPEAVQTVGNCFRHLKPGGYFRIAVPDANNPNSNYQDWNAPNGSGQRLMRNFVYTADEPTHQVFYNVASLSELLKRAGFAVRPLEFYGADGIFYRNGWSQANGKVHRSFNSDYLNWLRWFFNFDNTSLIVDGVKPHKPEHPIFFSHLIETNSL